MLPEDYYRRKNYQRIPGFAAGSFFREDADVADEKKLCNIYVKHDLEIFRWKFFAGANEITKEGIRKGDSIYPRVKEIADSLNAIYGVQKYKVNNVPKLIL
jgi:NTE family protein